MADNYQAENYREEGATTWVIGADLKFDPSSRMLDSAGDFHIAIADVATGGSANLSDCAATINTALAAMRGVKIIDT